MQSPQLKSLNQRLAHKTTLVRKQKGKHLTSLKQESGTSHQISRTAHLLKWGERGHELIELSRNAIF